MSEQTDEDRKRETRRRMLGEPIEHGGGYRSPRSDWIPDAGCCGLEVLGAVSVFAGLLFTAHSLLP